MRGEEGAGREREPQRLLLMLLEDGKVEGGEGEKEWGERRAERSMDTRSAPHIDTQTHIETEGRVRLAPSRFMYRQRVNAPCVM